MKSLYIAATLGAMYSTQLFAGWASGGGMVHRDELNPWFLENTSQVHYCIDIDETQMGVTTDEARTQVKWALAEWKSAFKLANDDYYDPGELEPYGNVRIATQKFIEVSCAQESVDLRFQLGTLTAEQLNLFKKPSDYIGIAYRTDYDLETLKGSGFVYVAPTKGPLKPIEVQPSDDVWRKSDFYGLKHVLLHELGHVFGIAHQPNTVMDALFPEMVVSKGFFLGGNSEISSHAQEHYGLRRLFGFNISLEIEGCNEQNPVGDLKVFELNLQSLTDTCGRVVLKDRELRVYFSETGDLTQLEPIASGYMIGSESYTQSALSVYLPAEQKVFSKFPEPGFNRRLFAEEIVNRHLLVGDLRILASGTKLPIRILSTSTGVEATLIHNAEFKSYALRLD